MTVGLARHLSRTKPHRDALLKNLVTQLFQHGSITSTHEKCKEASRLAERAITIAKRYNSNPDAKIVGELQSRLFHSGDNSKVLKKLLQEIAPRCVTRPGGYTRVLHLEPRLGDRARQSVLELVDNPVIDQNGKFQRGNLKLWLLCKTMLANESAQEPYSDNTLQNFRKIVKFQNDFDAFLSKDVLAIRKFIKLQEQQPWDEEQELQQLQVLKQKVLSPSQKKNHSDSTPGFNYVSKRPERL